MEPTSQRHVPLILFVVALALLGARIASSLVKPAATAGAVRWISIDDLQKRQADRPVLLFFTADWSAAGRALDAEGFQDAAVAAAINERFIPVRVVDRRREDGQNAARVDEFEQHFFVKELPTVIISDGTGSELARMEGSHDREELMQFLGRFR